MADVREAGTAPLYGSTSDYSYASTESLAGGTGRIGAYWSLGTDLKGFAPSGKIAPPAAVIIDENEVKIVNGVPGSASVAIPPTTTTIATTTSNASTPSTTTTVTAKAVTTSDGTSALRFTGVDEGCVEMTGFTAPEDSCLFDPGTCTMTDENLATGISLSFWINLPNSFETRQQFVLDTGADEVGGKGIKIYFTDSTTGDNFNEDMVFLLSTGKEFWKTSISGMLLPYQWNNVGVRWSSNKGKDQFTYGLQVFVNGISTAWKRLPQATGMAASLDTTLTGKRMTVGCQRDYTQAIIGRMAHLAVWYWQLRTFFNGSDFQKPLNGTDDQGEIPFFRGGLGNVNTPCLDNNCMDQHSWVAAASNQPWLFYQTTSPPLTTDDASTEDTTPAVDGDCLTTSPATWHGNNPMDCADTVNEMTNAVSPSFTYNGVEFVHAAIRTVNKAGLNGLSDADVIRLRDLFVSGGYPKLQSEGKLLKQIGADYMDVAKIMSKMTEPVYQARWQKIHNDGSIGLTEWADGLSQYLVEVAQRIGSPNTIIREANHTVVYISNKPNVGGSDFVFPNYWDPLVTFHKNRTNTWGNNVRDNIRLPMEAMAGWGALDEISLQAKLYNIYDECLPAKLSTAISGLGTTEFFINSRVISLNATTMKNPNFLVKNPLTYTVALKEEQDDRPFRKGAILCVWWSYRADLKIGSWETSGCQLSEVNDTHAICACTHMTDFAILTEDYTPPGYVADSAYIVCEVFYIISLICLFIFIVVFLRRDDLHYEIHTIHANMAFALFMAIIFYMSTWSANSKRVSCIIVSVFLHYFYTATYVWFCLAAHYVFRAITSGKVSKIMFKYSLVGWGVPAILVSVMCGLKIQSYGIGYRCLATVYNYYMYLYIGSYLFFCLMVFPLLCIAVCNLNKNGVKNSPDWHDLKFGLIGICIIWPLIFLTWLMAMLIYIVPQDNQGVDFMFDFFNSLQGILVFVFLGVFSPPFRNALMCKKPIEEPIFDENGKVVDKRTLFRTYYN